MNKQQLIQEAKKVVNNRRQNAFDQLDERLKTLRGNDDWRICEQKLKQAEVAVAVFKKQAEEKNVLKYTTLRDELLAKYQMTKDDLQPKFFCKACQDTGYVGGKMCSCLQDEVRKLIVKECNLQDPSCRFDVSRETNKHNLSVYKAAKNVCEKGNFQNILLMGQNGTGKTFLLTACANLCAKLGKSVTFLTAYNLNALFLECHLSDLATNKAIMDSLNACDVLVIDDLGTEITYRGVTAEFLFVLLNERKAAGKQTFVSTNLSLQDIRDKYDERIFSRLIDQKITLVAKLEGSDKRFEK